jgi:hypothetical protein
MNLSPFLAKVRQVISKVGFDRPQLLPCEAEVFSQLRRPVGAMQIKQRFTAIADHMHMGWTVIVRIDHDSQSTYALNGRHVCILSYPICLGLEAKFAIRE